MSDNETIDSLEMSPEDRKRFESAVRRMVELGMGAVYGVEDEGVPDADFDCESLIDQCKAVCCTMHFALTKGEVKEGLVSYNKERPYFIAREADGYCPHLIRDTFKCGIWNKRPLRCRRYACSSETSRPF